MTIQQLNNLIIKFRDDREWKQFHNPKDLAISLSIEVGELLECFQWKNTLEIEDLIKRNEKENIEDEIADVLIYLILLSNEMNIDLGEAVVKKLEKNNAKYPVSLSKGNAKKYNEL